MWRKGRKGRRGRNSFWVSIAVTIDDCRHDGHGRTSRIRTRRQNFVKRRRGRSSRSRTRASSTRHRRARRARIRRSSSATARIAEVGDAATRRRARGRDRRSTSPAESVIPGLVMVHEHLYYPTGPASTGSSARASRASILAGGVTTMRTGGNTNGVMDIKHEAAIDARADSRPGDRRHRAVPERPEARSADARADGRRRRAARRSRTGPSMGATSFKAYMQITRATSLARRSTRRTSAGMKVTGHLCSVTYAEAADLGIDNLEHGFIAVDRLRAPTSSPTSAPGRDADSRRSRRSTRTATPFKALVKKLVDKRGRR